MPMGFPVITYGCESWTYKESWVSKNLCFWTVVLEKTLESPLDSKEIHQSILKEISPGCSLEGLMLKLKLQYFGHLMRRADSFEKTLMLGKIEGRRRKDERGWDGWMASLTQCQEFGWTLRVGDGQGGLACCGSWGHKASDMTEPLNWTEVIRTLCHLCTEIITQYLLWIFS